MKFRNSFVGNSSTCSFIAIGFKIADSYDEAKEYLLNKVFDFGDKQIAFNDFYDFMEYLYEETNLEILYNGEQGISNGVYVSNEILTISDDDMQEIHLPLEETTEEIESMKKIREKYFKDVASGIEIIASSRMC